MRAAVSMPHAEPAPAILPRRPPPASGGCREASSRPAARSGRAATLLLLLVAWSLLLAAALGQRGRLRQLLAATREPLWIDPSTLSLGEPGPGFDPRWGELFDATVARFPPLRADDAVGLEALRAAIDELSFVASAGAPRVLRRPVRLELELTLRTPVACVPVGERFMPVSADGTLLPGRWPAPPRVSGAPLPVLGPLEDGDGLLRLARAGDWLVEPEHLAALDVALSLGANLTAAQRDALGPLEIDATRFREASVEEPGVRLRLAGERTILFGRPPGLDRPGELPVERKWSAVRAALARLERGDEALDWRRVDVRWDHPEIELVHPLLAAAGAGGTGRTGGAGRAARGALVPGGLPTAGGPVLDAEPRGRRAPGGPRVR